MTDKKTLLWLQSGGCGGCSMSVLNSEAPGMLKKLELANIDLLWHPSISEASGSEFLELLQKIESGVQKVDIFCLEGSVIKGPNNTGKFHQLAGTERPMFNVIEAVAKVSEVTVAIGSCAAFGGITMASNNPSEATGLQFQGDNLTGGLLASDWRSTSKLPVINVAGCPTHPDWVINTLIQIALDKFSEKDIDEFARPTSYTRHLVHHGCPRNEFYEYKASAEKVSDLGCLMENLGCLGTQAKADCNIRPWNGSGSCLKGGYSCINCTDPQFQDARKSFQKTPKIAGIPIGLPTDMPKAWFVALSSLSKAATPMRLRESAVTSINPAEIKKQTNRSDDNV